MGNRRKEISRWSRRTAVAALAVCTVAGAYADRVILNGGRVLEGAVVKQTSTDVQLRTEMGTIALKRSEIREIISTNVLAEEVDGDIAKGRRDYEAAARLYGAALQKLSAEGGAAEATARVERKLAGVQQEQRKSTGDVVVQQLLLAQSLLEAGRWTEAETTLQTAIPQLTNAENVARANRMLAQARFGLAKQSLDSLDTLGQERHLKKAIEADTTFYKAHLALGEIMLRSAVTEKQGLEEILKGLEYGEGSLSEEESVKYHYLAGQKLYSQEDYANAATHLIQAIRGKGKYPAYSDADALAAKSYIKLTEANKGGDFRETIAQLNEALRLDSRNADARFLLGTIYLDQGDADKAIAELSETVLVNASYPRVHRSLARAYLAKKDYDKALEHLDLELQKDPNNYDVLVDRAAIYILLAEYEKAKVDVAKAIVAEPSRWNAYLKAAEMASAQEQYDEARSNLMKVLSLKPDAVEAYVEMGDILVQQKNYDDAKKWYNEVIQYLGKFGGLSLEYRKLMADAQTQLGVIDFEQESPRQAETRFATALQYLPDHPMALSKVGDVKRRLGEEIKTQSKEAAAPLFAEAEQYYKRSIEVDPQNADLYLSLAILYHQSTKEAAKALPNYMEYLAQGGRNAEVVKWVEEIGGDTAAATALLAKNDVLTSGVTGEEGAAGSIAALAGPAPAVALSVNTTTTSTMTTTTATVSSVDTMTTPTTSEVTTVTETLVVTGPATVPADAGTTSAAATLPPI